jgi:oxalate decarboxylase/phosphoglucose isomerase-like protein (cupin superfamily)
MRTIEPTADDIAQRIARFEQLTPIAAQRDADLAPAAADLIFSRRLLPVIALKDDTDGPFGNQAPIRDAGGFTMTIAACPPGTGPSLHAHGVTWETFTVLQSVFEFTLGDDGAQLVRLARFDTISVPPLYCRAFRNVGEEEGLLQVIISGGVHDRNDIAFPAATAAQLDAADERARPYFEKLGLKFNAGQSE